MPAPIYPISDQQLNELCSFLSSASYIYYPISTDFFLDLYNTGCRPSELLDVTRWDYLVSGTVILHPLKGNFDRSFQDSILSDSLRYAIINQIKPYQGLTLRQLESVLKKILPVSLVGTEFKSAIAYMFRYNRTKQLHNAGVSDEGIRSRFGWEDETMAIGYYTTQVRSSEPLPPVPAFLIVDAAGSPIVTGEGDNLIFKPPL